MKPVRLAVIAAILLAPATAYAGHGKPGLWTTTSTMTMAHAPDIPPEALEMMKQRHIPIPGSGQPFVSQMCMTQAQVDADKPPAMNQRGMECDTKVLKQTASQISADTVCHGRMEGTGHTEMSWRGDSHYEGSYHFQGTTEGQANDITTHFSGDFVKSDCGAVRPFSPPPPR